MPVDKWMEIDPKEKARTYIFPGNEKIELYDVSAIYVSSSGTHYVEHGDRKKTIVRCGWLAIELDVGEWTYPWHDRGS